MTIEKMTPKKEQKKKILVSYSDENILVDTVIHDGQPTFAIFHRYDRDLRFDETISIHNDTYAPLPLSSTYLRSGSILLPSGIEEYGGTKQLIQEIYDYIHKYCDLSEVFERIAPYYVLLTYIFETFYEIPYLRVLGDYGSGKSRFLRVIGSICFNPIIVNGGASVSSLFRMIEKVKGTLVLDEADFQFSDTTNDIIKLLNNGFSKGNPILRADGENFEPRAYDVFCPKIIGGRMEFRDKATESRCIVEIMRRTHRKDIPLNLGKEFTAESERLRNKLYKFRYDYIDKITIQEERIEWLEGRLNQILNPILSIIKSIGNQEDHESIKQYFLGRQKEMKEDRKLSVEGMIFGIIKEKEQGAIRIIPYSHILDDLKLLDNTSNLNPRKLGSLLKQYEIKTVRKNSGFMIDTIDNQERLEQIYHTFDL